MEKEFKTYEELLEILESRGIDISTPDLHRSAKRILRYEGYYNLINGYKTPFLQRNEEGRVLIPDQYRTGVTVDEIYALYFFDMKLRSIILHAILKIETNIKNLVSHTFSKHHGYKNYLLYNNFDVEQNKSAQNITKLIAEIQRQISSRVSDPSISHYLNSYGYIPLWVLNNILTLGTVSKFYSLMKQSERQEISKVFHLQDKELISILNTLSISRNICAHSNRLYCFRTKNPLVDLPIHSNLSIPKNKHGEYIYGKRDLFSVMLALKSVIPKGEYNITINQINKCLRKASNKLHTLTENDILSYMGFPQEWHAMLKSGSFPKINDNQQPLATNTH